MVESRPPSFFCILQLSASVTMASLCVHMYEVCVFSVETAYATSHMNECLHVLYLHCALYAPRQSLRPLKNR